MSVRIGLGSLDSARHVSVRIVELPVQLFRAAQTFVRCKTQPYGEKSCLLDWTTLEQAACGAGTLRLPKDQMSVSPHVRYSYESCELFCISRHD